MKLTCLLMSHVTRPHLANVHASFIRTSDILKLSLNPHNIISKLWSGTQRICSLTIQCNGVQLLINVCIHESMTYPQIRADIGKHVVQHRWSNLFFPLLLACTLAGKAANPWSRNLRLKPHTYLLISLVNVNFEI